MSTIFYRFEHQTSVKKEGKSHVHRESIIDGTKGLSFKFVSKVGDTSFTKVQVRELSDDDYEVETKIDEKLDKKNMTKKQVLDMVTKNKNLGFALNYIKKEQSKVRKESAGGVSRSRRKSSRKK